MTLDYVLGAIVTIGIFSIWFMRSSAPSASEGTDHDRQWLDPDRAFLRDHHCDHPILGAYMTKVFNGERTLLSFLLRPLERAIYAICGVKEQEDQHWTVYAVSMLLFSLIGFLLFYAIQRLQARCRSIRKGFRV